MFLRIEQGITEVHAANEGYEIGRTDKKLPYCDN